MTEKEKVLAEDDWPNWPYLPMINKDSHPTHPDWCGVMIAGDPNVVYIGNIFQHTLLSKGESHRYDTLEELLDVWRVD